MKIVLLGKEGQVGWELQRALLPLGELVAYGRSESGGRQIDLADSQSLSEAIRHVHPDVIVNAAAYTDVDKAESEPDIAHTINALALAVLADEARRVDACLVHYSTDYVFDGSGDRAWTETDTPSPINVYGCTKLEGELAIQQSRCKHLVLRTSWVYAARGKNFIKSILRLAKKADSLKVVDDQVGSPTSSEFIADTTAYLIAALRQDSTSCGTYHLAANGVTSWYGYAQFIIEQAHAFGLQLQLLPNGVEPVPSAAYSTPARRPKNSRLDCRNLTQTFGIPMPPWRIGVARVLAEIATLTAEVSDSSGA